MSHIKEEFLEAVDVGSSNTTDEAWTTATVENSHVVVAIGEQIDRGRIVINVDSSPVKMRRRTIY